MTEPETEQLAPVCPDCGEPMDRVRSGGRGRGWCFCCLQCKSEKARKHYKAVRRIAEPVSEPVPHKKLTPVQAACERATQYCSVSQKAILNYYVSRRWRNKPIDPAKPRGTAPPPRNNPFVSRGYRREE
jgi:hypothetical protein